MSSERYQVQPAQRLLVKFCMQHTAVNTTRYLIQKEKNVGCCSSDRTTYVDEEQGPPPTLRADAVDDFLQV